MKKFIMLVVVSIILFGITSAYAENSSEKIILYTFDGEPTDLLTIEEVQILERPIKSGGVFPPEWTVKIRNTSGKDLKMKESDMRIWYRYLDENYDTLYSSYFSAGYNQTIYKGRASQKSQASYPSGWVDSDFAKVEYLEFYGYDTFYSGTPKYEFTELLTVNVGEYFDKVDYK